MVGLSKAKSRSQLVQTKKEKTLVKTRSRAVLKVFREIIIIIIIIIINMSTIMLIMVLKDKNDPVSVITDDALDVRNNKKIGEKELQVTK